MYESASAQLMRACATHRSYAMEDDPEVDIPLSPEEEIILDHLQAQQTSPKG